MRRSILLDAGSDVILVYPEISTRDSRNNLVKIPAEVPVEVRATTSYDRSSTAELPGQIEVSVVKCITRDAPVGAWSRVVYDGQEWDLASPPRRSPGRSRATRHVSFTLRSRPIGKVPGA